MIIRPRKDAQGTEGTGPSLTFPSKHIPRPKVRELPAPSRDRWRLIGPSIVAAGVGLASGEFIPFPSSRP